MAIPAVVASEAALAELYRLYGRPLFRLAYRLTGSKEDAEDVVHDVFVGLPDALQRYEERGRLDAWLRRITARVALMQLRRSRRRQEVRLERQDASTAGPNAETFELQTVIDALPSPLRSVLVLKELEGYSHAEISEILDISVITSRVRLARALRRLRKKLGGSYEQRTS